MSVCPWPSHRRERRRPGSSRPAQWCRNIAPRHLPSACRAWGSCVSSMATMAARAELLQDVLAQVIAHAIGIPDRLGKQALHAIGSGFAGLLGQVPAVFALDGTQQALQVRQNPTARFWAGKARGRRRCKWVSSTAPRTQRESGSSWGR